MWEERKATLGYLAGFKGSRFIFDCRPCGHLEVQDAGALCASLGEAFTFANLTRRAVCRRCRMPVDGVFRTLEFGHADMYARMGRPGGWSGLT